MNRSLLSIVPFTCAFSAVLLGACANESRPTASEIRADLPSLTSTSPYPSVSPQSTIYPDPPASIDSYPNPLQENTPDKQHLTTYPPMTTEEMSIALTLAARPTSTSVTPTLTPSPTLTFTRSPAAKLLPAPLYFRRSMNDFDPSLYQIWRMERDGITLTQISHEKNGVGLFDITSDGKLVYISWNGMFVTDRWGENPKKVLTGKEPPLSKYLDNWFFDKELIMNPVWSPDGTKIAYRQDGVKILDLASGHITQVLDGPKWMLNSSNTPLPADAPGPFYIPVDWTPDGSKIVVEIANGELVNTGLVSPEENAKLINLDPPVSGCCDFSYNSQGQILFSSGAYGFSGGLWLIDSDTGKGHLMTRELDKTPENSYPVTKQPVQVPDGRIFFFTTRTGLSSDWPLGIAYIDSSKTPFSIPEDAHFIELKLAFSPDLWYPDASQVIVRDLSEDLWQIDVSSGEAHPFRLKGINLHWGPPE